MRVYSQVVVAEDDAEMRRAIARILETDGYEVIEVNDGLQLLDQIESLAQRGRQRNFMIVSHVRMPGLSGMDVLAAMRCANWRAPVILITDFPDDEDTKEEAAEFGAALLAKPFGAEVLLRAIRDADTLEVAP